jgi:hypothetical protein
MGSPNNGKNHSAITLREGILQWIILSVEASYKKQGDEYFNPFSDGAMVNEDNLDAVRLDLTLRHEESKGHHTIIAKKGKKDKAGHTIEENTLWKVKRLFKFAGAESLIPLDLVGKTVPILVLRIEGDRKSSSDWMLYDVVGDDEYPEKSLITSIRSGLVIPDETSRYYAVLQEKEKVEMKLVVGGMQN